MHSVLPPVLSFLFQLGTPYPSSSSSSSSSSSITIHDIESHGGLDEISIVVVGKETRKEEEEEEVRGKRREGRKNKTEEGNMGENEIGWCRRVIRRIIKSYLSFSIEINH